MKPADHPASQPMYSPMVVETRDAGSMGRVAAALVADQLRAKPGSVLVFPTGNTPLPMYEALRADKSIHWANSRLFHLDEYIPPAGPQKAEYETFGDFMKKRLWDHVGGRKFYAGHYVDPAAYETILMRESGGGPDMVILGVGKNGHIAFNEPGTAVDARTRIASLTENTLNANFGVKSAREARQKGFPTHAMTLGIDPILRAKQIVLLVNDDPDKKARLAELLDTSQPPDPANPATYLKLHPNVTVITDFTIDRERV